MRNQGHITANRFGIVIGNNHKRGGGSKRRKRQKRERKKCSGFVSEFAKFLLHFFKKEIVNCSFFVETENTNTM